MEQILTKDDFDQEKFVQFNCEQYFLKYVDEDSETTTCDKNTYEILILAKGGVKTLFKEDTETNRAEITYTKNYYLPLNQKEGAYTEKIKHFTFVFQTFVFMQVFNQINARKLREDELNVFSGIFKNMLFVGVTLLTFIIQMLMVEIGGRPVKSYPLSMS